MTAITRIRPGLAKGTEAVGGFAAIRATRTAPDGCLAAI
jgi:hypothetical protein